MKSYCAWLKAALRKVRLMPRQKLRGLHCRDCGWTLPWDTASLVCDPCRRLRASKIKRCCGCGWGLSEQETDLLCNSCAEPAWTAEAWALEEQWLEEQIAAASASKLFCCDMDLTLLASWTRIRPGWAQTTTDRYRCPACARIWLYVTEWHKDSGSEADWYPQQTEPWTPRPDEKRTRTKVYR